jgi:2-C-methyl-D-erythritol 2,4-cyclodiphosphate synthase
MILAGVDVPSDVGFDTHSDGDVICHALVAALAGAIADGDLGTPFPEDDPDAQNARSLTFVERFAGHITRTGYYIADVDC